MLLVDFLACTLRRVPLAGLPLLTVFSVPLSILGTGPSWYVFALTAAGFMAMLFVHEDEQISRWGRALERDRGGVDLDAFGVRTGAVRTNAAAIGGVVTALAIVVPARDPDPGRARLRLRARVGWRRRHQHQQPDGRPAPRPDPGRGHRPGRGRHRRPGPVLPPDRRAQPVLRRRPGAPGTATCRATTGPAGTCRHSRAWTRRWSGRSSTTPSARPTSFNVDVAPDPGLDQPDRGPRRLALRPGHPGLPGQRRRPGHRRPGVGVHLGRAQPRRRRARARAALRRGW